ncbi:MAG: RNA polymerase sigma factor [Tepidisphaeraceae bacterium]|jgi:RNA polymerase sigma factor (sigma-70 family)
MSELNRAEQYLLEQIRRGDQDGWAQLVERFQGRLLAFARSRSVSPADADDLVQDTFLQFLSGLPAYRAQASLETYLFMILRRRIIDFFRGRQFNMCAVQDSADASGPGGPGVDLAAPDLTASAYVRRDEEQERRREILAESLSALVGRMKEECGFRDLKAVEMLFYAQLRNKEIARLLEIEETAVALLKHRWLRQLQQDAAARLGGAPAESLPDFPESLLTEVWEQHRPSCPKRSTVGRFLLDTLDPAWHDYIDFHIHRLGCRFCLANLNDLQSQTVQAPRALRDRVLQSTVGFFTRI